MHAPPKKQTSPIFLLNAAASDACDVYSLLASIDDVDMVCHANMDWIKLNGIAQMFWSRFSASSDNFTKNDFIRVPMLFSANGQNILVWRLLKALNRQKHCNTLKH